MKMGKKISPEIIEQIVPLYEELKVKSKVAERLGISVSTVSKYLKENGAAATAKHKKITKITPELEQQINERYTVIRNMSQVGREFGISAATVRRHLSEENLQLVHREYEDRDALWYYIYRLFGEDSPETPVSSWNITQMQKFRNQGIPYRGQLLTLKYFYEVQKHKVDPNRKTIGIVPFLVSEAEAYYKRQARKADQIAAEIKKQLEKDRIEIQYNPSDYIGKKKKKKLINLNEVTFNDTD